MYTIATLDDLRSRLGMTTDADITRLLHSLQAASRQIERAANRHFMPQVAAKLHTVDWYDPIQLLLNDDLLELQTLINGDNSSLPVNDVLLVPASGAPAGVLMLLNGHSFTWEATPIQAVSVNGIWGWHDDWANAWRDSDDQLLATLNSTSTEIIVGFADQPDTAGESPRFQVGQLIRIEDEYLWIIGVEIDPESADTLTVIRGANGTTAVGHALNTPIEVFQPAQDIRNLAVRWAAWLYKEPDHGLEDMPRALTSPIRSYRRESVRV